jgi:hypothetical protein
MKKIVTVLLILVSCLGLFSCSQKLPDGVVISYGDVDIDENFFYSEVVAYKSSYLFGVLGFDDDSESVWSAESEVEGVTTGEAIINLAKQECCAMAWTVDYAKKNGVVLTEEDTAVIDEDLKMLEENCGGREEYLKFIEEYGFTEEEMRKNAEFSLYYEKGMDLLCAEDGEYYISDSEIDDYFNQNYIAVKHIYVNNVAEQNDEGTYVQISPENLVKKNEKADTVEKALNDGEDFDVVYAMSDDGMQPVYPDGMVITYGDVASTVYEEAAFLLEIGEWKRVDIADYGIYFIKRVEVPEDLAEERKEEIPYVLRADIQEEIYNKYEKDFKINEEYFENFDINTVKVK